MFGDENQFRPVLAKFNVFRRELQVEGWIDKVGWGVTEDADDSKQNSVCDL